MIFLITRNNLRLSKSTGEKIRGDFEKRISDFLKPLEPKYTIKKSIWFLSVVETVAASMIWPLL